jgi:hypothetical protein
VKESTLQRDIRLCLGQKDDLIVWRNNVGAMPNEQGQYVHFGVGGEGASDLLGIIVGPGRWFCVEIKTPRGRTNKRRRALQAAFRNLINKAGGYAVEVRSVEEADRHYQLARDGHDA